MVAGTTSALPIWIQTPTNAKDAVVTFRVMTRVKTRVTRRATQKRRRSAPRAKRHYCTILRRAPMRTAKTSFIVGWIARLLVGSAVNAFAKLATIILSRATVATVTKERRRRRRAQRHPRKHPHRHPQRHPYRHPHPRPNPKPNHLSSRKKPRSCPRNQTRHAIYANNLSNSTTAYQPLYGVKTATNQNARTVSTMANNALPLNPPTPLPNPKPSHTQVTRQTPAHQANRGRSQLPEVRNVNGKMVCGAATKSARRRRSSYMYYLRELLLQAWPSCRGQMSTLPNQRENTKAMLSDA